MPIVPFIPAIISAGVGIYGASQQKKAAGQALDAQTAANDKSLAAQQHALDVSVGVNQPFLNGGTSAFDALLAEYGLPSSSGQPARQPGQPTPANSGAPSKAAGGFAGTSPLETAGAGDPYYLPNGGLSNGRPGIDSTNSDNFGGGAPGTLSAGNGGGGSPMGQPGGQAPSYNAYLQANPDLAAEARRVTADGEFPSVGAYLQYHDQNYPNEGRPSQADPVQGQGPQAPAQPAQPSAQPVAPQPGTDLLTAQRPDAGQRPDLGPAPTFARPTDQAQPTFGNAPQFSNYFDANNFTQDPSYQFRLKQGLDSANTGYAARGLLKSSAAAKGITDYASNLASQEYGNAFSRAQSLYNNDLSQYNTNRNFAENNYQYGQNRQDTNYGEDRAYGTNLFLNQQQRGDTNFNNDRARTDTNFNTDRTYQTNRYDTRIGNLFDLAKFGTTAASNVSGATQANANNQTNIYGSQANSAAAAAQSRASANASTVGALGSAAGNAFAAYGSKPVSGDPYSDYSFYKGAM